MHPLMYYSRRLNATAFSVWSIASIAIIIINSSIGIVTKNDACLAAHALSMQPPSPAMTTSRHGRHNRGGDTTAATVTTTIPSPSSSLSLGAKALRELVLDAARRDEEASLDLNGIVWLEHINLVVGSRELAIYFYIDFLGMTPDAATSSFHVNLGQQQFHLAEVVAGGEPAQKITGSVGLVVPSLETIRQRLPAAQKVLAGTTQFAVLLQTDENDDDDDSSNSSMMTIRCPWGNIFHLYSAKADDDLQQRDMLVAAAADDNDESLQSPPQPPQKMVQLHASPGGAYAASRMTINRGSMNPGIRYVEFACRPGSVPAIATFYRDMLGCTVTTMSNGVEDPAADAVAATAAAVCCVCVGPGVHLVFCESSRLTRDDLQQMQGVHLCIYTGPGFEQLYKKLNDPHHLIWTNPRFVHLDRCDTWPQAAACRTLRFKHIVDPTTGENLLELEHETRPMRHGQFMKVLNYEPK